MLLLLTPYPAYSFSSGWAWSVMAAKCRENGQGSAVLELTAVFAGLHRKWFLAPAV